MSSSNLRDRNLIDTLASHIDTAIKASPCTCATLRSDVILELVLKYGLDSRRRIPWFRQLSNDAQEKFGRALLNSGKEQLTNMQIRYIYRTQVPSSEMAERNNKQNDMFQAHKLGNAARDYEEVAVAYNALLRYLWSGATVLSRSIHDSGELNSMLSIHRLRSIRRNFVSTSITQSPWFSHLDVSYRIKVTDRYREHALPLTYTSIFAVARPEVLAGPKSIRYPEDEVRIKNGTSIEKNTLEVFFRFKTPPSKSLTSELIESYSPLGPVHIECCSR